MEKRFHEQKKLLCQMGQRNTEDDRFSGGFNTKTFDKWKKSNNLKIHE